MKQRYNAVGDDRMTDEFMKPIIVDSNGLVQSKLFVVLMVTYMCTLDEIKQSL